MSVDGKTEKDLIFTAIAVNDSLLTDGEIRVTSLDFAQARGDEHGGL